MEQIIGLVTGILFGVLLQKGEVLRFEKQVGFMLLKDMTIIKFMFSAVLVGMVGIYLLNGAGMVSLSLKATNVAAIIVGGLLFGIGWAVAGYCPGTSVGALAEGRVHAVWAILGMLVGAAVFAEVYPALKASLIPIGSFGKLSLPQVLGLSPWPIVIVFILFGLGMFYWFEKKNL